jgi:hypothetical protein
MPSDSIRDFVQLHDLGADAILSIIDRAQILAAAWHDRAMACPGHRKPTVRGQHRCGRDHHGLLA